MPDPWEGKTQPVGTVHLIAHHCSHIKPSQMASLDASNTTRLWTTTELTKNVADLFSRTRR
jgi:hypothetical protein